MITLIRNTDGSIKTYSEIPEEFEALSRGESMETINSTFAEYSQRLTLSCGGRSGETLRVPRSSGDLTVEVRCPGETSVSLNINGTIETLPLIEGQAALLLGTGEAGVFLLQPVDTRRYCPAGQSV